MEIIGYSERGAMNALFYGMALDKNLEDKDEPIRRFLQLAGVEDSFTDFGFELYSEFSLSEFGNPDMIIIAKKKDNQNEKVVFFIEAKASCCEYYNLETQKDHHIEFLKCDKHENGHASNLFFQLRLKHYFFSLRKFFYKNELKDKQNSFFSEPENGFLNYGEEQINRFKLSRSENRKIGKNVIVKKMVNEIKYCVKAYYIAIIPKQINQDEKKAETTTNDYIKIDMDKVNKDKLVIRFGFEKEVWKAHVITWEEINSQFKDYVGKTIEFNQNEGKNQILNELV